MSERGREREMRDGGSERGRGRERKAGCQDESVAFVCCKESWDIKHDRSWGAEEMRQKVAWIQKGKLCRSLSLPLTCTRADGQVDLTEDFSTSHTSKHRTEGQDRKGRGGDRGTIGRPGDAGKVRKYSSGASGIKGNLH